MAKRRYFKTVYVVEVLSAAEPAMENVRDALEEADVGAFSCRTVERRVTELTQAEAEDALEAQGSDRDFLDNCGFDLDDEATDGEEDEELGSSSAP